MASPSLSSVVGFEQKLIVDVGGLAVANNESVTLATYSLGSCLGVTIYDPVARAGGLLHAMLPNSSINREKASAQPGIFVDSGLAALFRAAYQLKVDKRRVLICVAGGAQFLDGSGFFNIGQRNLERLTELLHDHGLTVEAAAVGGLVSRTMYLNMRTGEVRLKTSGDSQETILFRR